LLPLSEGGRLLTLIEVASMLWIGRKGVLKLIRSGDLKPKKVLQRYRFDPSDVINLIERSNQCADDPSSGPDGTALRSYTKTSQSAPSAFAEALARPSRQKPTR